MRALRMLGKTLLWLVVGLVALVLSALAHAGSPLTRRVARDVVNQLASTQMRGVLVIDRIDELSSDRIVARHVALFDASGQRVVVANRLVVVPEPGLLLSLLRDPNTIRVRSARLTGGVVRLIDQGDGMPTLFSCFDSRTPTTKKTPSKTSLRVLIEHVDLVDATVYGDVLGLAHMRTEHLTADGKLAVGNEVDVKVHGAHGQFVEPFGFVGYVDAVNGTISTETSHGVSLDVNAHRASERVHAHVAYQSPRPSAEQELDLRLGYEQVSSDTLARMGFSWAEPLSGPFVGTMQLHGPVHDLLIEAATTTPAGAVQTRGTISRTAGVQIHLTTDSIALAKMLQGAPDASVQGTLDLAIVTPGALPTVRVSLGPLRYQGIAIPAIEAHGVIESDHVRIDDAHTSEKGARFSAHGTVAWNGSTDLDVDAYFPRIERDPNLSHMIGNVHGSLRAQLHVVTPNDSRGFLDINGKVVLEHFVYGDVTADRITLSGSVRGNPKLPTLRLTVLGENTSVLAYALGTARFGLRGGPSGYEAEGEFQAEGQKTFYFNAKVLADSRGFVVQADPIEFAVGENTWRGVARDLRVVNGDRVELGLLRLASRSQRLEAHAEIRAHGEDYITAQLQDFDLAAVHALLGARFPLSEGRADATVEVHGDVTNPTLVLQGAMRGGKVYEIAGVGALFSINYTRGHLDADTELDVGDRGTLNVKGQADFDVTQMTLLQALERGRYDFQLDSDRFDLTVIPQLHNIVLSGRSTGSLHASGTLDAPSFDAKLVWSDLRLPDTATLGVTATLEYHGQRLSGEVALSDTAGPVGQAHGSLQVEWAKLRHDPHVLADALLSGTWDVSGQTNPRRLDHEPFTLPQKLMLPLVLGTNFDLRRTGGPAEGFIRFTLKPFEKFDYEACQLSVTPELRGMVHVQNGTTEFSFTGHLDGERIASGSGNVDLAIDPWLHGEPVGAPGRMNVQGVLDVADMARVPFLCDQGKGNLHAEWSAKDLLTDAPTASAKLVGSYFPNTRVRAGRRLLSIDSCDNAPIAVELSATVDAKGLRAEGSTRGCRGGPTTLDAFVPVIWNAATPMPTMDEQRETRFQLDFADAELRPILDRIPGVLSFSALARGRLVIVGSATGVSYTGSVALSNGQLYPIATGQQLREITATIVGNGNWMKIDSLSAKAGDGTLAAEGGIGFERWAPRRLQLALVLKKFPVQREGVDLAWLTGGAAISTEIGEERARTAIVIHSLAARLPDANSRSLQSLEPHPDVTLTTEEREHPEIPYVLEFFVDGRKNITVKRNDFDATVTTQLAMSYQDPDFRVGGYVEFQRGSFEVFGKQFALNRGTMHFDGTGELNPEVNMVATHEPEVAGGAPVVVMVTGTLANPKVDFYSDSCPGDGAVVMLVSGRCPTDDPNSGGSAQDAQDAFAAGIVGGILTLGAKRELGGLIPRISVESTGQGVQTRLKAGFEAVPKFMRSFVQRVYLQGAVSTSDQNALQPAYNDVTSALDFLIELYFPHNIVGSGKFSPERSWGLDVTWEP